MPTPNARCNCTRTLFTAYTLIARRRRRCGNAHSMNAFGADLNVYCTAGTAQHHNGGVLRSRQPRVSRATRAVQLGPGHNQPAMTDYAASLCCVTPIRTRTGERLALRDSGCSDIQSKYIHTRMMGNSAFTPPPRRGRGAVCCVLCVALRVIACEDYICFCIVFCASVIVWSVVDVGGQRTVFMHISSPDRIIAAAASAAAASAPMRGVTRTHYRVFKWLRNN